MRLEKLRRMSRQELTWRAGAALRIQRDRAINSMAPLRWRRADLRDVLSPEMMNPVLATHIDREDWPAVQRTLTHALRARPRNFIVDPRASMDVRNLILDRWPGAAAVAANEADRIVEGRYDVLGYRDLSFTGADGRIDWHRDPVHRRSAPRIFWSRVPYLDPAVGDHKLIWELNRHQHWLRLGRALWLTRERRYGWAIVSQLEEWMEANPPLSGINWVSALEIGFRSLSWLWALHFLLADTPVGAAGPSQAPWLVDLLIGLDRQLRHVEQNLSYYFSPNTHLTGEALALYVAGLSLPELAASNRWRATGRKILLDEIDRQVGLDGGHAERSAHYHRYTLDFYLLALLVAERARDAEAIGRFTDVVTRLAEFARTMADDRGRSPLIGDDDGGMLWPLAGRACHDVRDSLALAAVVLGRPDLAPWGVPEEAFWIAPNIAAQQERFVNGYGPHTPVPASQTFPDTGYVIARDGAGGHLVFDVGPHGYMNGAHAHDDALSITLTIQNRPLLVDPGTSTYTMNPGVRNQLRRARSHNTLTLNGCSPSVPSGPFHWRSRVDARLQATRHNPAFDWAEGHHDGYAEHRHRRTLFRTPHSGWFVVDEVLGRGRLSADLHWHFDPRWVVAADTASVLRATCFDDETTAWLVHEGAMTSLHHGDRDAALGWFAPVYGTLLPTWSARVTRAGIAPFALMTCIATSPEPPSLTRAGVECDAGGTAIAFRVVQRGTVWMTVMRPGEGPIRENRGLATDAYHSDARLLHYGSRDEQLMSIAACDATHVLALRDGWLSVAADAPMADLYVECVGERIDVWSSSPITRLHLQGALVANAGAIRLNGRELHPETRERRDSIVATAASWGEPGRITSCAALPASQI